MVALVIAPLVVLSVLSAVVWALARWIDPVPAIAVAAMALFGVLRAAWDVWRYEIPEPEGQLVDRAAEPELWSEVDRAAALAGAQSPGRLVVDGDVNASVLPGKDRSTTLILGYPLIVGYDRSEFFALLLHEMSHAAHGTRSWADTARERLAMTADNTQGILAAILLESVLFVVEAVAAMLGARHEEEGDRLAVRHAGVTATVDSLRRLPETDLAWDLVLSKIYAFAAVGRRAPLSVALRDAVAAVATDPAAQEELKLMLGDGGGIHDPHGSLEERIAAAQSEVGALEAPVRDARPALGLFHDQDAHERAILPPELAKLPLADWEQVLPGNSSVVADGSRGLAYFLVRADAIEHATGGAVLDLAEQQPFVFEEFVGSEQGTDALPALHALAQTLAVQQLPLRWRQAWPEDELVDERGRVVLAAPSEQDTAAYATSVKHELTQLGARLDVEPGEGIPALPAETITAATALKASGQGAVDLVLCSTGLALVPTTGGLGSLVDRSQSTYAQAERAEALLDLSVDDLRAQPGVRWIPADQVRAWRVDTSGTTRLRMTDGSTTKLSVTGSTQGLMEAIPLVPTVLGPGSGLMDWYRGRS